MEKNNQSFFYHRDGLGSVTEMTDLGGAVVQTYNYSSFGKIESQLAPSFFQPYTFTAREMDAETGLYFFRARNFDPATGRFVQQDPIDIFGERSPYVYVDNNSINFVDPLGLDSIDAAANYAAGFGDMVTFGVTNYIRTKMGLDYVVDKCSTSYSAGWWTGMFHQLAFSGVGSFHGGARTVFYSGDGALEAARATKGVGRLLEDTIGGKLLNMIDKKYPVPESVWKGVSAIFSLNAKGNAQAFLREPRAVGTWNTVERPLLDLINKIHSATGSSGAKILPM
jgi:RHS repeat-associated protein